MENVSLASTSESDFLSKRMELFSWMSCSIDHMTPSLHKITETENVISHTYNHYTPLDYEDKIERIKNNTIPTSSLLQFEGVSYPKKEYKSVSKSFYTITFDKKTGKISLSMFEVGKAFNHKTDKFYPIRKKTPIFCYSDKLYTFISFVHKGKKKVIPVTGAIIGSEVSSNFVKVFAKKVYSLDEHKRKFTLPITLKYYENTKDEYDVIEKRLKVKIPNRLRKAYSAEKLYNVIRVLRNKNEITTLNMWAAQSKNSSVGGLFQGVAGWFDADISIYRLMALHMLDNPSASWLIRDWIRDHIKLGKKLSLSVRSVNRIKDEHMKMSQEIARKELSPIKVASHYLKMYKNWPIPESELITTRERLREESRMQNHCVATYGGLINSGSCAIISIVYKNHRYTLQVNRVMVDKNKYDYRNAQLKGYENEDAPQELHDMINEFFESIRHPHENTVKYEEEYQDLPF